MFLNPCRMQRKDTPARVISLDAARRKREIEERQRLEQLVIERWTGKHPEEKGNEES
jgi:hypothetical protein